MTALADFQRIGAEDHGLCVAISTRPDGSAHASVVNAGVFDHPLRGQPVVALVAAAGTRKLANWRARPHATLVAKSGWQWVAVEGAVDLVGPDDPVAGVGAERLRLLLREIFAAAGGTHDHWDEFDRVMAAERRVAVFVTAGRVYSNG